MGQNDIKVRLLSTCPIDHLQPVRLHFGCERGAVVKTPAGEGKVTDLLAPVDSVTVDLGEGKSATFKLEEIGSGASRERSDDG